MIVDDTKKILNKFDIMPKKGYGQNFLISKNILEKIVKEANITKDDYVIEIGPGLGSLTEFLCLNAKRVLCYEIDDVMINVLQDTLKDYNNKVIIHGDVLKQNIKQDINTYFEEFANVKVVANLPYYITTPILFELLEIDNIKEEIFMVQKEMGERFTGVVNSKDYNALSVFIKYFTDTKKAFIVGKNCFFPAPNVDSIILHSMINKKDLNLKNEANFLKFIKICFAQRRKTMVNNLNVGYGKEKTFYEDILIKNGFNKAVRSECLNLEQFSLIYKDIFE